MAAVTFSALKTKIQRKVNRPSATYLDDIGDAIVTAIQFWDHKPVWFTETSTTLSLVSGDTSITLPANFKCLDNLQILVNGTYRGHNEDFRLTTSNEMREVWRDPTLTQAPVEYALRNNTIIFNCIADQTYTLRMDYNYGDTTYPSVDGDISVWFDDGVNVIMYEAMSNFYADRSHDYEQAAAMKAKADSYYNGLLTRSNSRQAEYMLDA